MSVVTKQPSVNRVIIHGASWETYESLMKDLENRNSPRLAFDAGVLEIMTTSSEHEGCNRILSSIVEITLEEMGMDFMNLGQTTFKRDDLKKGFEPDSCFYIQSVRKIRGKKRIDMKFDPPPDLLIEVDLSSGSLNKFRIYAAIGVPEVWRYEDSLEIWLLEKDRYVKAETSIALPVVTPKFISGLVEISKTLEKPQWIRLTRDRIRARIK